MTFRDWLKKLTVLIVVAIAMGYLYGWASPRMFPKDAPAGFGHGVLHGALMPMALPSLLMGMNVEIFSANQTGRLYKVGYICGINLCGLIFFGSLFWKPSKKPAPTAQIDGPSAVT